MKRLFTVILVFIFLVFSQSKSQGTSMFILNNQFNSKSLLMMGTDRIKTNVYLDDLKKVKIGIIDNGIKSIPNLNAINLSQIMSQKIGHGTIVTAIINSNRTVDNSFYGLIPGIPIYAYNLERDFSTEDLVEGIHALINENVEIISISVSNKIPNSILNDAMRKAIEEHNVIFIVSAGNTGQQEETYPASYGIEGIVSVGSLDGFFNISDFSTYNPNITFFVRGEGIVSLGPEVDQITSYDGTSVAVPFVTTIFAILKVRYPHLDNLELISLLKENSEYYIANWRNTKRPINILNIKHIFEEEL
ncbi:S8 family peptidase [Paenibacillus sp. BIC5C1]|uniref:S8 family peptidase n=1 Tax=Paenibacillus sp. BIC5C1 TaxID=3078263 RepID=UPI0028F0CAB6|nr:S8 family serine peptidase [Paenibacillus sp. BIC5C1]